MASEIVMPPGEVAKAYAEELEKLKGSTGWKILMYQLGLQRTAALIELAKVDPDTPKEIRRLQNEIARFEWFVGTVDEFIRTASDLEELEIEAADDGGSTEP